METVCSPEMVVSTYKITRCYNREDQHDITAWEPQLSKAFVPPKTNAIHVQVLLRESCASLHAVEVFGTEIM
jgi:hypothetical protein